MNLPLKDNPIMSFGSISHAKKIIVMGLTRQFVEMNVMQEGKTYLFEECFQRCFMSMYEHDGKIHEPYLTSLKDCTKDEWYDAGNPPRKHKRSEMERTIERLYKLFNAGDMSLGDAMISKRSGLINGYCDYLHGKGINDDDDIDLNLLRTKVKRVCEEAKVSYTGNLYSDLDSILAFIRELGRDDES